MRWTSVFACGLVGLLCVGGCGKVNVVITKDLELGQPSEHILGPYKKDQKLLFTVTPSGAPIDFFVFLEADREAATKSMNEAKGTDKLLLVSRKMTQETKLETTVPKGNEAVMIMESLGGKSPVKVTVTSP